MFADPQLDAKYPSLSLYSDKMRVSERAIVGRDTEISQLMAALSRPELCNALLLGPAGGGKTTLVQGAALRDVERTYREIDLARMIAESPDAMAPLLKKLFDEAEVFTVEQAQQLVLFIDEFHLLMQLSPAAAEALKPVLAASGQRGIRVIAATTFDEFNQWVRPNQALTERLQRINLASPDENTTVQILRGIAQRYDVSDQFYDDHIFHMIYEYTQRYIPASTQPRKSIKLLDTMIGWHRESGRPMDRKLLADSLMEATGVNVAFRVDATRIKEQLDTKVLSQDWATAITAQWLHLCVADLNDKSKPISFLLCGSSGTGKTELTKQLAKLLFDDDRSRLIRFDMSEFALDSSLTLFRSELTKQVSNIGHAVLLLDEIEKAGPAIVRVLLQVLDDGRLSDDNGRQVSFLNCYVVMTTNAGSEIFATMAQYNVDDTGSGKQMAGKMKEIKRSVVETQGANRFPPELMGRIDAVVPFQPLSLETQRKIIKGKLQAVVQEVLNKHNVRVTVESRVLQYLIDDKADSDSDSGGARAAISNMTFEVTSQIAAFINAHPHEDRLLVDVKGIMRSENKNLLQSDAHILVTALSL